MSFNKDKCKIMHVGNNNPSHEYYMKGMKLATVEEEKDIGVKVHRSLKPGRQCQKAANTGMGVLYQLKYFFHYRDRGRNIFVRLKALCAPTYRICDAGMVSVVRSR
jgi:hypothetical protein